MWSKIITTSIYIIQNWYKWWVKFLTILGRIKVYKTPCYLIYDPNEFDYNVRGEQITEIQKIINPGDIVLRGYKHYLDGFLIPGEFSHSGVYIGNNKIIHAIASGVQEIDIIDFFQCDRFCIIRPNGGQEKAIERVKKWIGKGYDFKFDTNNSSEFYCHELTANAYIELQPEAYPIKIRNYVCKLITPKYIANSFLENKNFEIIKEYK